MKHAIAQYQHLASFLPKRQAVVIFNLMFGDEGEHYANKMAEIATLLPTISPPYGQREAADPTVYLHYFAGRCDWWITERDNLDEAQWQAYGFADIGYGPELGYISIEELIQHPAVELDLFFTPRPRSEVARLGD